MKKKIAMLFAVIMILSCMPVMAADVPAGASAASAADTMSVSAVKQGWTRTGTHYRYYVNGTYFKNTIRKISGSYYGFDANGYLLRGWFTLNKKKYYASNKLGAKGYGRIMTGLLKVGNYYYYFNPKNYGAMVTGLVKISKRMYYFNPSTGRQLRTKGAVIQFGDRKYVVQADGSVLLDQSSLDRYGMDKKAQGYSSSTRYMILVNKGKHKINVYQGSKGNWVCIRREIPCTTGKSSTPSPSGKFTLNHRTAHPYGWKDFKASTAFYAYRISAGNYFHSILYKKGSRNPATASIKDGTLGKNRSNSCIRMPLQDAKFVYTTLPVSTRVVVY